MKIRLVFYLFLMHVVPLFSQNPTGVSGVIIDAKTKKPLQNVVATILNTSLTQLSDVDGKFLFNQMPLGQQLLQIRCSGYQEQLFAVAILEGIIVDLGTVVLEEDHKGEQQMSLVAITESDLTDDNSGSESTTSLLQSSRDVFQQAAAFNWGQARYRMRGLDSEYATTMINGILMNKISDGRPQWSNWGGLNDATRNQEFTVGVLPSDYTFGGVLGTQEINTRASIYRPGSRISFSGTNTNYSGRVMGTHVARMNQKGWAYVVSAGKRWAKEGYFEGTNYDAVSLLASIEKRVNASNSFNFTAIYAQNDRAKNSPTTDEVANLLSEKYNNYWGWQEGKKRNSRVKSVAEPIVILGHYLKINENAKWNTNVAYQWGKVGNSRIDYQVADNPDPTYYKKLPSYWTSLYASDEGAFSGAFTPNYEEAARSKTQFLAQPQMDWKAMYQANANPITDANQNIIGYIPAKSKFILYEDRTDDQTFSINSNFNSQLNEHLFLNVGGSYRNLKSNNFKYLLDLLGGTHYEDVTTFGITNDQNQTDLNHPNRMVYQGDTFGYHYTLSANLVNAFTQFRFTYKKVDFYLAQTFSHTVYQREGHYKNGYYPTNSLGKSERLRFENFGFKGGMTYKISGKQFLTFNAAHLTKEPTLRNTFPNARLNNNSVDGITSERISSLDASYIFRGPRIKARLTTYFSKIDHATETAFYYADGIFSNDDSTDVNEGNAFVCETVMDISKKNMGVELGFEYQVTSTVKLTLAAAQGQYTYDNNPTVLITNDAQATPESPNLVTNFGTAAMKNYHQPGMPQQAYSFGVEYRDPNYWNIGANINYLRATYLDVSPIMRTNIFFKNPATGFNFPEATLERGRELLKQEKFHPVTLLNLIGGKSWRLFGKTVGFFASINNVLGVTYKTGGFEQARNANFRQLNQDVSSGTPAFAPKYFYGYGRTYFVNLYLNF